MWHACIYLCLSKSIKSLVNVRENSMDVHKSTNNRAFPSRNLILTRDKGFCSEESECHFHVHIYYPFVRIEPTSLSLSAPPQINVKSKLMHSLRVETGNHVYDH